MEYLYIMLTLLTEGLKLLVSRVFRGGQGGLNPVDLSRKIHFKRRGNGKIWNANTTGVSSIFFVFYFLYKLTTVRPADWHTNYTRYALTRSNDDRVDNPRVVIIHYIILLLLSIITIVRPYYNTLYSPSEFH